MIRSFSISGFRNLAPQKLDFHSPYIIVTGANGSGKTSFLESIYTLFNGKSFRTNKTNTVVNISDEVDHFVLRGVIQSRNDERTLALKKSKADRYLAKVDGDLVASISDLAAVQPTQIIEPKSFNLLDGGASARRRFLDWGVFHVEHQFAHLWKSYSACLKQRNRLLRNSDGIDELMLSGWDMQLSKFGESLTTLRNQVFEKMLVNFDSIAPVILGDELFTKVSIKFYRGWDSSVDLGSYLESNRHRDILRKQSLGGAQRADIKVLYDNLPIHEGLSRGQQKLLVLSLHLSMVNLVRTETHKNTLLLLDDISSELDQSNTALLVRFLLDHKIGFVASALENKQFVELLASQQSTYKPQMFHVEHGKISELKSFENNDFNSGNNK